MHRTPPSDSLDTGWFLGCTNREHDHNSLPNLRRISLYEAMVKHQSGIVLFLGLPTDIKVIFKGEVPIFKKCDKELSILPDSYLHRKYFRRG